jgi:molecular chaperone Hsp33
MHSDAVVPFVFESLPVRGAIIQLGDAWRQLLEGHNYEPSVRETLGHAAAATALLAQSLKAESSVTLQITGDGPLSMLVMQCNSELQLRGLASDQGDTCGLSYPELVAKARCAITVRNKASERPYQGIVEVGGDSLAASLETYYQRSAQIPSHLALLSNQGLCGGLLLQQMPGRASPDADDWRRLGFLAATLRAQDLLSGVGPELVGKLFAEDDVRVFDARSVTFRCPCSRERAANVLQLLGADECAAACRDDGLLVVTCEYCGAQQRFDTVDIAGLFNDPSAQTSDAIH